MKGLNIIVNLLLLLTYFEALHNFFGIFSLESLIGNEWSSELETEDELHSSEDKLDSWMLSVWKD